jgi:hypothetical protein
MLNGRFINGSLQLYVGVHTSEGIDKLISMLNNRYGFICSMYESKKDYYIINIDDKKTMNSIKNLVTPFFLTNKLNKIGLFGDIKYKNRTSNIALHRENSEFC